MNPRLDIRYLQRIETTKTDDGQEIITGLTQQQKTLPARYFYDAKGSLLFEQICKLPEYYPTRTEAQILEKSAAAIADITQQCELIELGSGSSTKTRFLLSAYHQNQQSVYYSPIDVSASILENSAKKLLAQYASLKIRGLVGTYDRALANLPSPVANSRMLIFLGSSLGNFSESECDRFLEQIAQVMNPGDYFLLGVDLQKPVPILEAAYNDSQGVTAAFNLNMLTHLNNLYRGDFQLDLCQHKAIYNQARNQIEMYLEVKQTHTVSLSKLDLIIDLQAGETIRTEISRKFNLEQMQQQLSAIGLNLCQSYTDENNWFGLLLLQK